MGPRRLLRSLLAGVILSATTTVPIPAAASTTTPTSIPRPVSDPCPEASAEIARLASRAGLPLPTLVLGFERGYDPFASELQFQLCPSLPRVRYEMGRHALHLAGRHQSDRIASLAAPFAGVGFRPPVRLPAAKAGAGYCLGHALAGATPPRVCNSSARRRKVSEVLVSARTWARSQPNPSGARCPQVLSEVRALARRSGVPEPSVQFRRAIPTTMYRLTTGTIYFSRCESRSAVAHEFAHYLTDLATGLSGNDDVAAPFRAVPNWLKNTSDDRGYERAAHCLGHHLIGASTYTTCPSPPARAAARELTAKAVSLASQLAARTGTCSGPPAALEYFSRYSGLPAPTVVLSATPIRSGAGYLLHTGVIRYAFCQSHGETRLAYGIYLADLLSGFSSASLSRLLAALPTTQGREDQKIRTLAGCLADGVVAGYRCPEHLREYTADLLARLGITARWSSQG